MGGSAVPSTSSESGKGTQSSPVPTLGLTGSGSQLRASQRDYSMTARSPSGERRPSANRRTTTPLLQPVAAPATSLARSGAFRGGERKGNEMRARVWSSAVSHRFVRSILTENRTIEINGCCHFGLFLAQVGVGIAGPSLRRSNLRAVGWVTGHFFLF
jgi:hypothetical protein